MYWKYAKNDVLPNGTPVVVVPLLYGYDEPIFVGQEDYTPSSGKAPKLNKPKADVRIQKKLIISKNGDQYHSCVMAVIPSNDYRTQNKRVSKDKFDGSVLVYDEAEQYYMLGLIYKNGKLKEVLEPNTNKGGRLADFCYRGIYQNNPPAQLGGGGGGMGRSQQLADQYAIPMAIDFGSAGGDSWYLVDVQVTVCGQNTPRDVPRYNPDYGSLDWFRGGGGGPGGGPIDPNIPVPVDEGIPGDLSPVDAFTWEMQNRIGTKIYFDYDEIETIRDYPQLMTSLRNYIQQYNRKPDGSDAFILSYADQQLYPKFTELVRQLPNFVENDAKVRNALLNYTGYSYPKLRDLLEFGRGPQIYLVDNLTDRFGSPVIGLCDCDIFDKPSESKIQIKENYIQGYELDNGSLTRRQATAFLLAVTVLHEFVHYGRNQNQLNDYSYEFGESFEIEAFGVRIGKDNAGKLSYRLYQNR